ncbi:MAG: rhomboid family intramembrane serine protease, partial [Planctomycetota bacterium]
MIRPQPSGPNAGAGAAFARLRSRSRFWSVSSWIAGLCVVAFVLQASIPAFTSLFAFTVNDAIAGGQVWRFITFQFLHGGLTHIAFNLFGLMIFGNMVERKLGKARFLAFYLL